MNQRLVLAPGLAAFLAVLLLAGPLAAAASAIVLEPVVQTFNITLTVPVFNQTVQLAANSTYTISVSLPANWTSEDIQAIHVIAQNIAGQINLVAKDANGTNIATGTIVPLASGYHQTLPPTTKTIELSSGAAANATIIVLVQSKPIRAEVQLYETKVSVEPGAATWAHGKISITDGPAGIFVWTQTTATSPLQAKTYAAYYNPGDVPDPKKEWDSNPVYFDGPGVSKEFSVLVDAGNATNGTYTVTVNFYASPEFSGESTSSASTDNAEFIATVQLSGTLQGVATGESLKNIDYKSLGIGAAAALFLALLFLGGGKGGRRGASGGLGPVVLLLLVLAAIGFSAGLIDVDTKLDVDPKMLGVGILAVMALLFLIKQGAVPAPKPIRRLLR